MTTTMAQALNAALRDAMTDDESVVVFGEDVGTLGGVFRITDGLARDLGEDRCFDTPLAESGIVGFALGMAMNGFRPVVEIQFDAFAYPAFEQLVSHVSRMRNRTRGAVGVPMVIRFPTQAGSAESSTTATRPRRITCTRPASRWRRRRPCPTHIPAARGDRRSRPVVFLEPKKLYWSKAELDLPVETAPFGTAEIRRAGTDATIVAYGPSVPVALEAAQAAMESGQDLEVVDLRTLVPFDDGTVTASVRRTGRCVVVQEAAGFSGVGAEIAARVQERCFHSLDAPVLRVTGFDIPYPPPIVERYHLPGVDRILDAVGRLQWDDDPDRRWLAGISA